MTTAGAAGNGWQLNCRLILLRTFGWQQPSLVACLSGLPALTRAGRANSAVACEACLLWAVSSLKRNTGDITELEFGEDFSRSSEAEDLTRAIVEEFLKATQVGI